MQVMAEYSSIEEVEMMKDMFTSMDTDGDGKVTYEELIDGLEELGAELVEPEIKMIMEVVRMLLLILIISSLICLSSSNESVSRQNRYFSLINSINYYELKIKEPS